MKHQIQLRGLTPGIRGSRGVTLIELLITVVIVAILASIAIPSYSNYVLRSHRTEAKTALLDIAAMQERFYSTQNQYATLPNQLGYTGGWPVVVGNGYYQISVTGVNNPTATTPATYLLTAVPIGMQVGDAACTALSVDQSGTQAATGSATATVDCWK